jgi:sulfotransferase family protein
MGHEKAGIFFLSTGRCGTQWLQKTLAAAYPDTAVVTHEPVRGAYEPKLYLRAYDKLDELLSSEEVSKHLSYIREVLKSKTYIETGWPCYPALPLLMDQLDGRVRVVHLVRHPVHVALSLSTHKVYERQDWISRSAISPSDRGVVQKGLADVWAEMGMYEKCLFWWTEINLYALELKERRPDIEFRLVRYEDLFGPDTQALEDLTRFMSLAYDPSIQESRLENVDRYHWKTPPVDWELIFKYERTVALAEQLGYDFNDLSPPHIATRYFDGVQPRPGGKWRRLIRSLKNYGGPA